MMETTAIVRGVCSSAQRGRLVADPRVRGKPVDGPEDPELPPRRKPVIIKKVGICHCQRREHNFMPTSDESGVVSAIYVEALTRASFPGARERGRGFVAFARRPPAVFVIGQ